MRRADRLFQIIQIVRSRRLTTAAHLAEELETSVRTIYRDINDLICSGVPILGEAGVGYTLKKGYDLPPLMFSVDEITALRLGGRIVESWADANLARHAQSALAKIEQVLPNHVRTRLNDTPLLAVNLFPVPRVIEYFSPLRAAIDNKQFVQIHYTDGKGRPSVRRVRPLCMTFFAPLWMLTAWCEHRNDFRSFRLDRIDSLETQTETFVDEPGRKLADFLKTVNTDAPSIPPKP